MKSGGCLWLVKGGWGGFSTQAFGGVVGRGGLATLGLIPIPVSNRAEHLTGN